jgi:alkylation response protein AidB-like acyl-CoA dehydrogenase
MSSLRSGERATGRPRGPRRGRAGGGSGLTARDRELIERARELARETLEPNAARYDESAAFPVESFEALRAAGFFALVVPREYGGHGLGRLAYARVLKELAQGCASTAVSFHMHHAVVDFLDSFGTGEQKGHYYGAVTGRGALIGSWGAEPSTTWAGPIALSTHYRPVDGGYRVTGSKYFCSLGEGAAYGLLYAVAEDKVEGGTIADVQFFIVDVSDPGVDVRDEWDPLGMRATVSKPVILSDCFVPELGRVGRPGDITKVSTEFYSLGYATVYQGIAEAAFARAVRHAQTRTVRPSNQPIGSFERVQRKLGEASLAVHSGALAVDHAARVLDEELPAGEPLARLHAALQAKAIATRVVLDVTRLAIEVAGGPGVIRGNVFERYLRDGHTAVLMVPAYDQCVTTIARQDLGFDARELQ